MVAGSFLLAACTDGSPTDGSDPQSSSEPPRAEQVWSLDAPVIGQPVAAGDVALVYVAQAQELALVGVDAATGEQLWSQPASPGAVITGIAVAPKVVESADGKPLAAYFRPDPTGNLFARLVLADPRTGQDVVASQPMLFSSTPDECPDDQDVCARARPGDQEPAATFRLRLADGSLVPEPDRVEGLIRGIGPEGISDVRLAEVEYLARVEDGAVVWQTPIDELFGPGYSTDGGWGWEYYAGEDLFVGFVRQRPPDLPPGSPREFDLSSYVTVAIDASTGERVWRDDASLPYCSYDLPLPRGLDSEDEDVSPVPIRCRYAGSAVILDGEEPVFDNLEVTVEGFDAKTGETTWTLPLGAVEGLVFTGGVGAVAGPEEIVLPAPDGAVIVNLLDGATRDPASDEVLACQSERVTFDYREPYYFGDVAVLERSGGTFTVPCLPDGTPSAEPMSTAAIQGVALDIADRLVLAVEGGLVGYQLG